MYNAPKFWQSGGWISFFLLPLSIIYYIILKLRLSFVKSYRPKLKVICVGGLLVGGTGKTPVSIALSKYLKNKNFCFLANGYGGKIEGPVSLTEHRPTEVGDEALLLGKYGPVIIAKDRLSGILHAEKMAFDYVIMDDGLQNPSIIKDTAILVIDCKNNHIKNKFLLPAGPFRETYNMVKPRIDYTIVIDPKENQEFSSYKNVIKANSKIIIGDLINKKVIAFAAIANPERFFNQLKNLGVDVVDEITFPDHYIYSKEDINKIIDESNRNSLVLITTEKDYVKIPKDLQSKINYIKLEVEFDNNMLEKILQ